MRFRTLLDELEGIDVCQHADECECFSCHGCAHDAAETIQEDLDVVEFMAAIKAA